MVDWILYYWVIFITVLIGGLIHIDMRPPREANKEEVNYVKIAWFIFSLFWPLTSVFLCIGLYKERN